MAAVLAGMPDRQSTQPAQSSRQETYAASTSKKNNVGRSVRGERTERELKYGFKQFQIDHFAKLSDVRELPEFQVESIITVRQYENVMSAIIGQLLPGSNLRVLQTGALLRSARVRNESFGEGWISLCSPSGRCVLAPKRASAPLDYGGAKEMKLGLCLGSTKDGFPNERKDKCEETSVNLESTEATMAADPYLVKDGFPEGCRNKRGKKTVHFQEGLSIALLTDVSADALQTPTPGAQHSSDSKSAPRDLQVFKKATSELQGLPNKAPHDWYRVASKHAKKKVLRGALVSEMALRCET